MSSSIWKLCALYTDGCNPWKNLRQITIPRLSDHTAFTIFILFCEKIESTNILIKMQRQPPIKGLHESNRNLTTKLQGLMIFVIGPLCAWEESPWCHSKHLLITPQKKKKRNVTIMPTIKNHDHTIFNTTAFTTLSSFWSLSYPSPLVCEFFS